MVKQRDTQDLINAVEKFLSLTNDERKKMGQMGREKVVNEFDRNIIIEEYMKELKKND